jgi:hypothetical protein
MFALGSRAVVEPPVAQFLKFWGVQIEHGAMLLAN